MKYADLERIPAAVAVLRQLLWVEPLVVRFDESSAERRAIAKLCRAGQVILQEEQLENRWVNHLGMPAQDKHYC